MIHKAQCPICCRWYMALWAHMETCKGRRGRATRALLSLSLLACGCATPTEPGGWYRANGAGFYCAAEPVVLPIEDGSGQCAYCSDEAMVCGPAVDVQPEGE